MKVDFGHIEFEANFWVKQFKPIYFRWHFSHPKDRRMNDGLKVPSNATFIQSDKVYGIMDLQADKKVSFSLSATDEVGNPVVIEPGSFTFVFSVDNTGVLSLTDNADGSGEVAAVSVGVATLSGQATRISDGKVWTGAEAFNVVAGDAETFAFEFGDPEEQTPDV